MTSNAAPLSDFSRIYENMRGEDLTQQPYTINFNFNNQICVSEVLLQRIAPNRNDSNVAKIAISYTTSNGSYVLTSDGQKLVLQSPDNDPTIREQTLRCNIQGIQLTILNMTNNKRPAFVRVLVIGCYGPSKQIFI